ncbi:exodeoxyribonuclease V subunit gamma [Inmirania thermothiophila]|uniref:RecBCD enzyme subunit RecC n=1 Tax=Inmirania thermothiophila TaxID=1750597 RepID=A0A3N1Y5J0_9GAMM|nr:exodeoxyribonuclease V subunit gamma [Inmirania thermothiophila]ROR32557.1 DNA helicase/exodeoxyribonuclease V gamma subunit [Inmirania thermothiophila]
MLTVHHGNRLERLAARLATELALPRGDALTPDTVVVPNAAVGRWLALRLADHLGIAANLRLLLPAEFAWTLFARLLGDVPARTGYDTEALTWRVLAALEGDLAGLEPLAGYLARAGRDPRQRLALARRLAAVLDVYQTHRPDWILRWDSAAEAPDDPVLRWQARLWRRIAPRGAPHWPCLLRRCLERLAADAPPPGLPPRLDLFALPALSPGYLDLLEGLARHIPVALYVLDPCRAYWGDVVPERLLARRAAEGRPLPHAESGHPLLASLGQQVQAFLDALWARDVHDEDHFEAPSEATLLGRIQRDILDLRPPAGEPQRLAETQSLQIHVCHGPLREVEALHDRLLDLFARQTDLAATDVAVLVPDLATYAPLVEAVFGAAGRIPYTVAERAAADGAPLVTGFLGLLEAARSRFEVDRIADLLEIAPVRRRLGLGEGQLPLLRHWLRSAGVRWGRDGAHRAAEGLPAVETHTWAEGLRRLLLGYALPGEGERLYDGLVPCDDVEGQDAEALGLLCRFVEALGALGAALAEPRPPAAWRGFLLDVVARFLAPGEADESEHRSLCEAVEALAADAEAAGFDRPVPFAVVESELRRRLARPRGGSPRLARGVVVGPMRALRGLPFRVVCLLGLNDGDFPRVRADDGLDRTRAHPRRGDPDPRAEDRGLFLDALLSARDALHLSYVGRDERDDSPRPPSVVLAELMDLVRSLHGEEGLRRITVVHRLQPFHPDYFRPDGPLYSHDATLCEGARRLVAREPDPTPPERRLFPAPLPAPEEPELTPQAFARLLRHPVDFLLRERLGVRLETAPEVLEAREPFLPDPRQRQRLRAVLLRRALRQGAPPDPGEARALLSGLGLLPHGEAAAALAAGRAHGELAALWAQAAPHLARPPRPPLPVDLEAGPLRVRGVLDDLREHGRLVLLAGRLRAHHLVEHWVLHLLAGAVLATQGEPAPPTHLVAHGSLARLAPTDAGTAAAALQALGALAAQALRKPVPFVPVVWLAEVADALREAGLPHVTARDPATAWEGSDYVTAARDDPALRLVFGEGREADELDFAHPPGLLGILLAGLEGVR